MKKFLVEICLSTCMVFLPWGLALAISFSPTTITISQPVHFLTPDGTDVIVNPGNYDVGAAGNILRLQSSSNKDPIPIQAGPAPFPDEVESPVAMAIPMPEGGIYLALAVPEGTGLEAMGSYSAGSRRGEPAFFIQKTPLRTAAVSFESFCRPATKEPERSRPSEPMERVDMKGPGTNFLHIPK